MRLARQAPTRFASLREQVHATDLGTATALLTLRDYVLFFNHNSEPASDREPENAAVTDVIETLSAEMGAAAAVTMAFQASRQGRLSAGIAAPETSR